MRLTVETLTSNISAARNHVTYSSAVASLMLILSVPPRRTLPGAYQFACDRVKSKQRSSRVTAEPTVAAANRSK